MSRSHLSNLHCREAEVQLARLMREGDHLASAAAQLEATLGRHPSALEVLAAGRGLGE